MNAFVIVLFLAVAASAGHIGIGIHHHIPSGSIGVSRDGVVVAGPAGSVATDNGLHGHGAGARLSGPSGDVRTHGGHVELQGPGNGHGGDEGSWGGDDGHWNGGDDGQWHGDASWGNDDGQWRGDNAWGHDDGQWHGDGAWGNGGGWAGNAGVWGGHSAGHVAIVVPGAVGWGHGHGLGHHGW